MYLHKDYYHYYTLGNGFQARAKKARALSFSGVPAFPVGVCAGLASN